MLLISKTWAVQTLKHCGKKLSLQKLNLVPIPTRSTTAYANAQLVLGWWKFEKLMMSRMDVVNLAIKECHANGYKKISSEFIKHLPKDFIINIHEDIEGIYDRLPERLKDDEDIKKCLRCDKHFSWRSFCESDWDGKNPKRKDCYFCITQLLV